MHVALDELHDVSRLVEVDMALLTLEFDTKQIMQFAFVFHVPLLERGSEVVVE